MRAKFIYEKFKEKSDPIADMGIGAYAQIKKKYENSTPGYYLIKAKTEFKRGWAFDEPANYTDVENGKFLMYNEDDDDDMYEYLKNKLGEWSVKNAHKWDNYSVIYISNSGETEIYSW